jgi:hypothetical protein
LLFYVPACQPDKEQFSVYSYTRDAKKGAA